MTTTFAAAPIRMPATSPWQTHNEAWRPVPGEVLVKVRYENETLAEAEATVPLQAAAYDWSDTYPRIVSWRRAQPQSPSLSNQILAKTEPWLAGMASPFMQRFIFGSLILAAATFVAMIVVMIS